MRDCETRRAERSNVWGGFGKRRWTKWIWQGCCPGSENNMCKGTEAPSGLVLCWWGGVHNGHQVLDQRGRWKIPWGGASGERVQTKNRTSTVVEGVETGSPGDILGGRTGRTGSSVTRCPYTLTHEPSFLEHAFNGFGSLANLAWIFFPCRTGQWFQELSLAFR